MENNLNKKTRAELMALLDSLNISYRKNDKKQVLIDKASANLVEVSSDQSIESDTKESISNDHSENTEIEKEKPVTSTVPIEETLDLKEPKINHNVFGQVDNNYSFDEKEVDSTADHFKEKDQLFHHRTPVATQEDTFVQENNSIPNEALKEDTNEDTNESKTVDLNSTRKEKYKDFAESTADTVEKSREKVDVVVDKTSNFVQKTYDNLVKEWQEEDKYLSNQSKLLTLKDYYLNLGFAFTSGMLFLLIIKYFL